MNTLTCVPTADQAQHIMIRHAAQRRPVKLANGQQAVLVGWKKTGATARIELESGNRCTVKKDRISWMLVEEEN